MAMAAWGAAIMGTMAARNQRPRNPSYSQQLATSAMTKDIAVAPNPVTKVNLRLVPKPGICINWCHASKLSEYCPKAGIKPIAANSISLKPAITGTKIIVTNTIDNGHFKRSLDAIIGYIVVARLV
jgi:hypothetical protein